MRLALAQINTGVGDLGGNVARMGGRLREGQKAVPDPDRLGLRSKLGGMPDWVQGNESPRCQGCRNAMTFFAQIDSMEHESRENPHSIDALSDQQHVIGQLHHLECHLGRVPDAA